MHNQNWTFLLLLYSLAELLWTSCLGSIRSCFQEFFFFLNQFMLSCEDFAVFWCFHFIWPATFREKKSTGVPWFSTHLRSILLSHRDHPINLETNLLAGFYLMSILVSTFSCRVNEWTNFYMIGTFVMKELNEFLLSLIKQKMAEKRNKYIK